MTADSGSSAGHPASQPESSLTTFCATHPKVETSLRCGKCSKPICPKCLVFTPVGARCRNCADLRPLPMFQVGPAVYGRAIAAALLTGVVGGFIWVSLLGIPFVGFFLVAGMGYVAGEAISRAANRKHSRGLQVIAGGTVLLAWIVVGLVGRLPLLSALGGSVVPDIVLSQIGVLFSNPLLLLVFALAVYIAAKKV